MTSLLSSPSVRVLLTATVLLGLAGCGRTTDDTSSAAHSRTTRRDAVTPGFDPLPKGIDWEMPYRFPQDTNGDGVREEHQGATYLRPDLHGGYSVLLKGCPTVSSGTGTYTFTWTVNGDTRQDTCETWWTVLAQGTYDVRLRIDYQSGSTTQTAEYQRAVTVKDWLIVSLGDSYGSGEGAPDVRADWSQNRGPLWADARCHRSFNSASARAALQLEESDPHSSVTYVSLACSGATISRRTFEASNTFATEGDGPLRGTGLLSGYVGIEPPPLGFDGMWDYWDYLPAQVEQMDSLVGNRPIDALVISGGGNDVGFADILKYCVENVNCHEGSSGSTLRSKVDPLKGTLPGRYDDMSARLASLGVNIRNTYLVEYPDFTRGEDGQICPAILEETNILGLDVSYGELKYLTSYIRLPLLDMMRQATASHGWNYVTGIAGDFGGQGPDGMGHGLCARPANRWINNGYDASSAQGPEGSELNTTGKAHPNDRGYQAMADRLLQSFYATQPTLAPDLTLLRAANSPDVFMVVGGARLRVPSWDFLSAHYGLTEADVREVPQATLEAFAIIPSDGTAMQEEGSSTVYVTYGNQKYPFPSWQAASSLGVRDGKLWSVPAGSLAHIPTGRMFDHVDANRDGCTDLVRTLNTNGRLGLSVSLSDCTGGYLAPWTSLDVGAGAGTVEWLTGDADADGRTDLFQLWNNGGSLAIIVWRSNGTGYEPFANTTGVLAGINAVKFLAVDVNGDKRTDIVQLWNSNGSLGLIVHKSECDGVLVGDVCSGGTRYVTTWGSQMPAGVGAVDWLTGDANGDGRTDLFQLWNNGGSLSIIVWRSNGTGYEPFANTTGVLAGINAVKYLPVDVNGDKRTDIVQLWNNNGSLGLIVHENQCDGVLVGDVCNGVVRYVTRWSSTLPAGVGAMDWLTGDVDGDRKTDIFQLWNNSGSLGVIVWRSNGVGYEAYGNTSGVVAGAGALKFQTAVNQNGRLDLVQLWNNQGKLGVITHAQSSGYFATGWSTGDMGQL